MSRFVCVHHPCVQKPRTGCSKCGREARHGHRFCTGCGEQLETTCDACGTALKPNDDYCGACGRRAIREGESAATRQQRIEHLARLEVELADKELELQVLKSELSAFRAEYMTQVGFLYAELDELKAEIAKRRAAATPDDLEAREASSAARERASRSSEEARTAQNQGQSSAAEPTDELKRLFREVAKAVHPDLAHDDMDREARNVLMRRANQAFDARDAEQLRAILDEARSPAGLGESLTAGEGVVGPLLENQIHRVERRIEAINEELLELRESDLGLLRTRAVLLSATGVDMLRNMADAARREVLESEAELAAMGG